MEHPTVVNLQITQLNNANSFSIYTSLYYRGKFATVCFFLQWVYCWLGQFFFCRLLALSWGPWWVFLYHVCRTSWESYTISVSHGKVHDALTHLNVDAGMNFLACPFDHLPDKFSLYWHKKYVSSNQLVRPSNAMASPCIIQ